MVTNSVSIIIERPIEEVLQSAVASQCGLESNAARA